MGNNEKWDGCHEIPKQPPHYSRILVTIIVSTVGSTSVDGSRLTIVPDMTVTGGRVLTQLSPQLHTIDGVHFMQGPQLLCR